MEQVEQESIIRRRSTLMPRMQQGIEGGFAAPPEETGFEIVTEIDA
jgi:hypothetical protein